MDYIGYGRTRIGYSRSVTPAGVYAGVAEEKWAEVGIYQKKVVILHSLYK